MGAQAIVIPAFRRLRSPTTRGALGRFAAVLLALLTLTAQTGTPPAFRSGPATLVTASGRHPLRVEFAVTSEERTHGLMFRRSLAPDAGMLFDFGEARRVSMWMRNTYVPLDMLFLDAAGRVTRVAADATPLSTAIISSGGPARGVLELPAGTARRLAAAPGDRLINPLFGDAAGP